MDRLTVASQDFMGDVYISVPGYNSEAMMHISCTTTCTAPHYLSRLLRMSALSKSLTRKQYNDTYTTAILMRHTLPPAHIHGRFLILPQVHLDGSHKTTALPAIR